MNNNAFIGRNVELFFKNSIGENPEIIKKLQDLFSIKGRFLHAISTGLHSEKADVKMEFADGHNIDANIKAYKHSSASYNQLTRTSIANFCKRFDLGDNFKKELETLFIAKAKNTGGKLFPADVQDRIKPIFQKISKDLLAWGFSYKASREILVIYERDSSTMFIYSMKKVFSELDKSVSFTGNGNIAIGKSVIFQRKGGNGIHSKDIPKDSLKHPGNNIQLKLKMKTFIQEMSNCLIAKYQA